MALALPNDDRDLLELAPDILIALADVATLIGIRKLDRRFGILGGEFAALSELLRKPSSPSQEEKFRKRVRKLFREIERAFTVCVLLFVERGWVALMLSVKVATAPTAPRH